MWRAKSIVNYVVSFETNVLVDLSPLLLTPIVRLNVVFLWVLSRFLFP